MNNINPFEVMKAEKRLKQQKGKHDKWQKITDDDRERQAGIVDGKPVTVNEKKHHRAGFQSVCLSNAGYRVND